MWITIRNQHIFTAIASNYHSKGDEIKAVEILKKCIELNPEEAVLKEFLKKLRGDNNL